MDTKSLIIGNNMYLYDTTVLRLDNVKVQLIGIVLKNEDYGEDVGNIILTFDQNFTELSFFTVLYNYDSVILEDYLDKYFMKYYDTKMDIDFDHDDGIPIYFQKFFEDNNISGNNIRKCVSIFNNISEICDTIVVVDEQIFKYLNEMINIYNQKFLFHYVSYTPEDIIKYVNNPVFNYKLDNPKWNENILLRFGNLSLDDENIEKNELLCPADFNIDSLIEMNSYLIFNQVINFGNKKIQFIGETHPTPSYELSNEEQKIFNSYMNDYIKVDTKTVIFEQNLNTYHPAKLFYDYFKKKKCYILSSDNRQMGLVDLSNDRCIENKFGFGPEILNMYANHNFTYGLEFYNKIYANNELKIYKPPLFEKEFKLMYKDICDKFLPGKEISEREDANIGRFYTFISDLGIFEAILKYIELGDMVIYAEDRHCRAVIKLIEQYINLKT
jgi:hypothetical protein